MLSSPERAICGTGRGALEVRNDIPMSLASMTTCSESQHKQSRFFSCCSPIRNFFQPWSLNQSWFADLRFYLPPLWLSQDYGTNLLEAEPLSCCSHPANQTRTPCHLFQSPPHAAPALPLILSICGPRIHAHTTSQHQVYFRPISTRSCYARNKK